MFGHSSVNPLKEDKAPGKLDEEDMAGGFLPEGYEEDVEEEEEAKETSSFFPVTNDEDGEAQDDDLVMEDHREEPAKQEPAKEPKSPTPGLAEEEEEEEEEEEKPVVNHSRKGAKRPAPSLSPEPPRGTRRSGRQARQRVVLDSEEDSGDEGDAYQDRDDDSE